PQPNITPETAGFWRATTRRKLLLPQCRECDELFWYPRATCPNCLSNDIEWLEASGKGTVYSFTISRRPPAPYKELESLVVAYVELEEGVRILTNVIADPPENVQIGSEVSLVFDSASDEAALYRFKLAT